MSDIDILTERLRTVQDILRGLGVAGDSWSGSFETGWMFNPDEPGLGGEGVAGPGQPPGGGNTGACCLPPNFNVCTVTTQVGCEAQGGYYIGDNYPCDSTVCSCPTPPCAPPPCAPNCPPPPSHSGYCCTSGLCTIQTQAGCLFIGGTYGGDGTLCDADPCPGTPPPGGSACCTPYGLQCIITNAA